MTEMFDEWAQALVAEDVAAEALTGLAGMSSRTMYEALEDAIAAAQRRMTIERQLGDIT